MAAEQEGLCPECQIGRLRPSKAYLFSESGGRVLSIPDFPAWICDVCALRVYDQIALAELRAMLEFGRPERAALRRRVRQGDEHRPGRSPTPRRRS